MKKLINQESQHGYVNCHIDFKSKGERNSHYSTEHKDLMLVKCKFCDTSLIGKSRESYRYAFLNMESNGKATGAHLLIGNPQEKLQVRIF